MTIYGYARVSTDGQTLDAQVAALTAAGAAPVFRETASGAKTDRRELAKAIKSLDAGDTLLVTRIDRLARSTRDLLNILDAIAKAGAGFRSLGDAWADTTTPHGRLMLTVLGGLAEFERELIRVRTGEGRERAKARRVHMGRPSKLTPHQQREAMKALAEGTATQADLARRFNLSASTISRLADKATMRPPPVRLALDPRREELR
jgi:DNA invertase Pin-like site-specific DNA recombinase